MPWCTEQDIYIFSTILLGEAQREAYAFHNGTLFKDLTMQKVTCRFISISAGIAKSVNIVIKTTANVNA